MEKFSEKKIYVLLGLLVLLMLSFLIGLFLPIGGLVALPVAGGTTYVFLTYLEKLAGVLIKKKKIIITVYFLLNFIFAFSIGLTIPFMESEYRFNMAFLMIPLLMILNYVIINRFHYHVRHSNKQGGDINER